MRGIAGQQARARSIQAWKQANKRFREVCRQDRCKQLSASLGITVKQLRRAFLDDLVEEVRSRRSPEDVVPENAPECDDPSALGAALMTRAQIRNEIIEDMLASGEPHEFDPTGDFGASSDFRPDWVVESDVEEDEHEARDDNTRGASDLRAASAPDGTAALAGSGLSVAMLPMASGALLPGLALLNRSAAIIPTRTSEDIAANTMEPGSQTEPVDPVREADSSGWRSHERPTGSEPTGVRQATGDRPCSSDVQ